MCEPSQADAFAAEWMASLAEFRVNPTASPVSALVETIRETFGVRQDASSSNPALGSSSLRTSVACSRRAAPSVSGETFSAWVVRLREGSSARRKFARRMNANGSSSSAWPTPDAQLFNDAEDPANWATPTAQPSNGDAESFLRRKGRKPGGAITDLGAQTKGWSTPSVADVTGGRASRSGARKSERLLNGQAPDLCSRLDPATGTHGSGSPETRLNAFRRYRDTIDSALRSERRALLLMAIRRRDRAKPGEVRRLQRGWTRTGLTAFVRPSFRRSLNPRFVGDLMGWPPGLTSFACSETAWSNWRARMRSELSRMSLHRAPPEQLTLFG